MNTTSKYVQSVDNAFLFIVVISVVILIGVTAAMIYFVIRYSRKRNPVATDIEGNLLLEIAWIAIPTLLVLAMFYYGFTTFKTLRLIPKNAMVIKVTGQMWKWSFVYDNGKRFDTLYVPVNVPVKLEMQSLDVVHSFYIPAFRIKEDVMANKQTYITFTADQVGTYDIACAEYCGMRHSYMYNKIHVIPTQQFYAWVRDTSAVNLASNNAAPLSLIISKGCIACHTTDGSKLIGPSFKQVKPGAKVVVITKGTEREVTIDDAYIRNSIVNPQADVVKGYPPTMPPQNLTEKELEEIIKIIKKM